MLVTEGATDFLHGKRQLLVTVLATMGAVHKLLSRVSHDERDREPLQHAYHLLQRG